MTRLPPGLAGSAAPTNLVVDAAAGRVFVGDPVNNALYVLASSDARMVATVPLPSPFGMTLDAAGTNLYVGSKTGVFFVLDPATLQVVKRVTLPPALQSAGVPLQPYAMADGSIFWGLGKAGPDGAPEMEALVRWHPDTGQFDAPLPDPNPAFQGYGQFAVLTGNRSELLMAAGGLYLYSETAGQIVASSAPMTGTAIPSSLAANPGGTQFVADFTQPGNPPTASVKFFNGQLQPESSISAPPQAGPYWLAPPIYSSDGSTLYLSNSAGTIVAVDTSTRKVKGYFKISTAMMATNLYAIALDAGNGLWGLAGGAVFRAAIALSPAMPAFSPDITTYGVSGNTGPIAGGTLVSFNGPAVTTPDSDGILASMQAYFGGLAGVNQTVQAQYGANTLVASSPPAKTPGPVTILLTDAQGNPTFFPDAFTYGPTLLRAQPNLVGPEGGDWGTVVGYGFGIGNTVDASVDVGGEPVNMKNASANSSLTGFPEHTLTFSVPAGNPGWAAITLTSGSGSATLPRGVQYAQQSVTLANPGYRYAAYDASRNVFYLSGPVTINDPVDHVAVFDPSSGGWGSPLSLAVAPCDAGYGPLAVSTDGRYLVASCTTGLAVFDLNDPSQSRFDSLLLSGEASSPGGPPDVGAFAIASTDDVVVNMTSEYCPVKNNVRELDLASGTVTVLTGNVPGCGTDYAIASGDGSTLLFATSSVFGSGLWRFDVASGSFTGGSSTLAGLVSLDVDGGVAASGNSILDSQLQPLWTLGGVYSGGQLNSTGSLFFAPSGIYGASNGRLLLSLVTDTPTGLVQPRSVVVSPDGTELLMLDDTDMRFLQLAVVPLAAGTVGPEAGAAGTSIEIRGSGFVSGTTATLGGQAMNCAVSDSETMSCTVPAGLPAGGAALELTNPDGQAYTVELAFTVE